MLWHHLLVHKPRVTAALKDMRKFYLVTFALREGVPLDQKVSLHHMLSEKRNSRRLSICIKRGLCEGTLIAFCFKPEIESMRKNAANLFGQLEFVTKNAVAKMPWSVAFVDVEVPATHIFNRQHFRFSKYWGALLWLLVPAEAE